MSTYVSEKNTQVENEMKIQRGEMWWAYLPPAAGSTQGGKRPVIQLQNFLGNKYSPTVIVAVVSSSTTKKPMPTHVNLDFVKFGLPRESKAFLEQILTIDKWCLISKIGMLDQETMSEVETAMLKSLGVIPIYEQN